MDLSKAYDHCMQITRNHYENFPVASLLIPPFYRKHIAAIYAFARQADDFSDELKDRKKLLDWRRRLNDCLQYKSDHPTFFALANTIKIFDLPTQWLDDLITAFLWDLDKNRFNDFTELLRYSKYSANPVGRIVLWIFNYRSEEIMQYADFITTALQLTNFWQDISVDLKKDKIYIPLNLLEEFSLKENDIVQQQISREFSFLLLELIKKTENLYHGGFPLLKYINGRLRWELQLTIMGGLTILKKVRDFGNLVLISRPALSKRDWFNITTSLIFK